MPGDVAMQKPCTRVVGFEGDDEIATPGKEGDVSARRVVEFHIYEPVPVRGLGLREDGEVVPVEMDLGKVRYFMHDSEERVEGCLTGWYAGTNRRVDSPLGNLVAVMSR